MALSNISIASGLATRPDTEFHFSLDANSVGIFAFSIAIATALQRASVHALIFQRELQSLELLGDIQVNFGLSKYQTSATTSEHAERPFFGELVEFITSGPLVAMVLEGQDAVRAARQLIGATIRWRRRRARFAGTWRSRWPHMVHGRTLGSPRGQGPLFFGELPERPAWSSPQSPGWSIPEPPPGARLSPRLILASASPQRRAALERLGLAFEVHPSEVAELSMGSRRRWRRVACARRARCALRGRTGSGGGAGRGHARDARGGDLRQAHR